jgi:hypothetical protein
MSETHEDDVGSEVDPAILSEAKSQGWVEKDHYRGNPNDWVDATKFVQRGREILPILKKNNENLLKDLNNTREQLKEFRQAAEEFKLFQREAYERKMSDYEVKIRELKESRAQAITDGDGQKVNALDDQLDEAKEGLKEAKQAAKAPPAEADAPPQPAAIDPGLQTWLDHNTWFGTDRRLTSMANGIGESLRLEFPSLKGQPFLDKLDEVLAEELPARFGKKRVTSSPVESGAGRQSRASSSGRTYDSLPADAKAACDRFVKQKLMTQADYLAAYDWS